MLAARLHAPGEELRLTTVPRPAPGRRGVVVRVAACGVCHTDLHIVRGEMTRVALPLTLGHEIAGFIDSCGAEATAELAEAGLALGDAVLVYGGWGCGACDACQAGNEQRCLAGLAPGFQADGGYAEFVAVPEVRHLVPLGALDPVAAAPLADAGVTAFRAVRRAAAWLHPDARVALIGFGALAQFALQYLRHGGGAGTRIGVCDPAASKRALASAQGATAVAATLAALGGGSSGTFDLVLDFVGTDATLAAAAAALAPGGLIVLVGEAGGQLPFGFALPALEGWLTTSVWGSRAELREVVALAAAGRLHWEVERLPLERASEALHRLAAGDVSGRLVLVPPASDRQLEPKSFPSKPRRATRRT